MTDITNNKIPEPSPDLIERLRNPDTSNSAFGEVVSMYSRPLYNQIRRIVGLHDMTDDLLQNTFMKAWQGLDMFRGEAKLTTWLYKIAINEALTFVEREKRRGPSLDNPDTTTPPLVSGQELPDGDTIVENLSKAISLLPEKQRLVFSMRYYDEMPYEEISNIMGTSVNSLKTSYHYAVKKIEEYFFNL